MPYLTFYEPAFNGKELSAQKELLSLVAESIKATPAKMIENSYFFIQDMYTAAVIICGRN